MNCNDVKNKLPEYLSGQCSPEEKLELSKHISNCPSCMKAMDELEEPILSNKDFHKTLDTGKLLNKARKALIIKVVTTTVLSIIMIISIFFVIIPVILKMASFPKLPNLTRSLADITQFTSPSPVGGYGNTMPSFGKYSFDIKAFTHDVTGTKMKGSREVTSKFSMLTGTYESPVQPFVQFIHPKVAISEELSRINTADIAKSNLIKNGDNTVAAVDISLNSVVSLEEVACSLKGRDVKVVWMAVECGGESFKPRNMSNSMNQYVQWGIPGQLYNPSQTTAAQLDYTSPAQYEKAVVEELKWLDKNKHYISANKSLLHDQGFDNTVGSNAKYIVDNGIKIYGLRITGPSSELSKLDTVLNIRREEVIDVDFYYWK